MPEPPRFLDRVRAAVRTRHYSRRTEEAYFGWTKRTELDFAARFLDVREGKDATDRSTMLPDSLKQPFRTIQAVLGHADVKTTRIYTHLLQRSGGSGVRSPLDVHTRESRKTRRPVDTPRPPQPIPRLIRCEPRSASRPSIRHRACVTLASPDACTVAARRATMRYAAQQMTMLLQPNATER